MTYPFENIRNPVWADVRNTCIKVDVTIDGTETSFIASPHDCTDYGKQIHQDCLSSVYGVIKDFVVPDGYTIENTALIRELTAEEQKSITIEIIVNRLSAIDAETIRPLRATLAGTQSEADTAKLLELEAEAEGLRAQLQELQA